MFTTRYRRLIAAAATLLVGILVRPAAQSKPLSTDLFNELHWRSIGPFRGGRTKAATGVPSQPNVFYIAP